MPYKNPALNSKPIFKKIITVFTILAVILLIFVVYFSLAKAMITLTLGEENKPLTIDLVVAATSTPGALAGQIISEQITVSNNFTVANFTESPGQAEGKVKIINQSNHAQTLIKTTRLLSPEGLLFRLKDQVTVPSGKEIIADVYADKEGGQYDLAPTKFTIPGLSAALQKQIYAVSETAMSGGIKKIGLLTDSDLAQAQEKMKKDLPDLIKKELEKKYAPTVFSQKLIKYEIINQKNEPAIGATVDKFSLSYQLSAQAVNVLEKDLIMAAQEKYKNKIIENSSSAQPEQIANWQNEKFEYFLKEVAPTGETALVETKITAELSGQFSIEKLNKKELAGFDKKGVEYYFSQYPGIKKVEVNFWPFWVRSVPASPEKIMVIVK